MDDVIGSTDEGFHFSHTNTKRVEHLVTWLENDNLRQNKAQPTARYFADMRLAFTAMKNRNHKGKIILVSGRQSTFYRASTREILYRVPVAELLAEEAEIAGLIVDRLPHVPLKKSDRNARPRSLDDYDETLLFLSND